ncbi:lysis protein, partial [Escherichia coli]
MPELSFADTPYRRCIPSLTETAARQGDSSARVCGDNQKRYTPGFTALTERGVVPS